MAPSAPAAVWLGADPRVLDDDALLTGARELGELRRLVEASLGVFAAEVKHRSRREDVIRIGTEVDPGKLLGARRHAVRVLVTGRDLRQRCGPAFIQDQTEAVSIATAEQHNCDTGVIRIHFADDGEPLRSGVTRRLFSSKQRDVLAARDGGCRYATGCSLCRHHRMLVHDNHWPPRDSEDEQRREPPHGPR